MRTGKTKQTRVAVKKTKLTTFLLNLELKEKMVLGEESFGIVFNRTFRGNKVATVTKFARGGSLGLLRKNCRSHHNKFRRDYIVHFDSCFIPTTSWW